MRLDSVGAIFASIPSVALVIFFGSKSPTLERHLSSFYLIRHEPMTNATLGLEAKIAPTDI